MSSKVTLESGVLLPSPSKIGIVAHIFPLLYKYSYVLLVLGTLGQNRFFAAFIAARIT